DPALVELGAVGTGHEHVPRLSLEPITSNPRLSEGPAMTPRPIRWGLLSTARINDRLIPAILTEGRSEVVAVASSRGDDEAQRYAAARSIPKGYGSYEAMLSDPEVDVVYLSLPNSLHADWSIRAMEAGKHVLCEKPLATRAEDVDRMAHAAERQGV